VKLFRFCHADSKGKNGNTKRENNTKLVVQNSIFLMKEKINYKDWAVKAEFYIIFIFI
jgi:hypothetical protein